MSLPRALNGRARGTAPSARMLCVVASVLNSVPPADARKTLRALGTGVLSLIGSVGAALTLGSRRGSVLLSLLVLPLIMPVLIFGARATDLAMQGEAADGPLWLLGAMLIFAITLTPFASAAALRISLE